MEGSQEYLRILARLKVLWYTNTDLDTLAEVESLFNLLVAYSPAELMARLEDQEIRIRRLEEAVFKQGS